MHVLTRKSTLFVVTVALVTTFTLQAAERMPLSDIRKGMKGYGLTVFEGTKVEKFDVEILGVLHNIGPDQNLILARVDHPVVARAGIIAGMSGSPIFIDGKVIGALAYAWQFSKEPRSRNSMSRSSACCTTSGRARTSSWQRSIRRCFSAPA